MDCICHISHGAETMLRLATADKVGKLVAAARKWIQLDKEPEQSVAQKIISLSESSSSQEEISEDSLYHPTCFKMFVAESKIARATSGKRRKKADDQECVTIEAEEKIIELSRKYTRSQATRPSSSTGGLSGTVLPKMCVICEREKKYVSKRLEQLCLVQTLHGGDLLRAAEFNMDQRLLTLLTSSHDLAAAEVRYHKSCRSAYVNKFRRESKGSEKSENEKEKRWQRFKAEVIDVLIIRDRGKRRVAELLAIYHKMFPGDLDHSRQSLRYRLRRDYSDTLTIHQSTDRQTSDLVTCNDVLLSEIVEDRLIVTQMDSTSATDSTSGGTDSDPFQSMPGPVFVDNKVELHHSALHLRALIDSQPVRISHPPNPAELSIENARESVPPELHNFICVMTGLTTEVPDDTESLLATKDQEKVLSICQDIMSLAGKTTPKSLALGLTIRHARSSKYILNLLSGLGHTPSYDTVLRAETGLAYQQAASRADFIPDGFEKERLVVLVYDNIDFLEETLTGSGTSHYTNGIMFQLKPTTSLVSVSRKVTLPKSKKTFTPTKDDISSFHLFRKDAPVQASKPPTNAQWFEESRSQDLNYLLLKFTDGRSPGTWTGINIKTNPPLPQSNIHYLPIIEASPTDLATVKHVLSSAINMTDTMKCPAAIVVFDQAVYSKAQMIRWSDSALQERLVVRLGEFHTVMSFLAAIGKRFEKSGLEDILVESEVVALGSMKGVMNGHMYNRAMRAHKVLFEAMGILQWKEFLEHTSEDQKNLYNSVTAELMDKLTASSPILSGNSSTALQTAFSAHVKQRCQESSLYDFWNSYLQMVSILLSFIRATRTADWKLHISSLRQMLPYFFAYDRVNYSRYGTIYWVEMCNLEKTHPWVYNQLMEDSGAWTYQRQSNTGFNGLAADQAIETTINRESKSTGGVVGISKKRGALQRWLISKPAKAAISAGCDKMAGITSDFNTHKELGKSRIEKDEHAVTAVIDVVASLVNPFSEERSELVSISSGAVADDQTKADLLKARAFGEEQVERFVRERLIEKTTDFFMTIKAAKLKTFASATKRKPKKGELQSIKSERSLFMQLLMVGKARNVDLKEILCYTLSPVPGCLSGHDQVSIAKTTKSSLLKHLESEVPLCQVSTKPPDSAVIIDAMAMIQSFSAQNLPETFGELAQLVLDRIVKLAEQFNGSRVDIVGDRYDDISIKATERARRDQSSQAFQIDRPNQKLPVQWKQFLRSGLNKSSLQSFLCSYIPVCTAGKQVTVLLAMEKKVEKLSFRPGEDTTVQSVVHLESDHEEADTRLILHAQDSALQHNSVVIWSPDTDVAVLGIGHATNINAQLLFATGTGKNQRLLDLTLIAQQIGHISTALPILHALTGCDTTSSFYGRGKKAAYKLLKSKPEHSASLLQLGQDFSISNVSPGIEKFVCELYNTTTSSINDARFQAFKNGATEKALPPNSDCLLQHIRRVNYQSKIWLSALNAIISAPSPDGNGWILEDGVLCIHWMDGAPAPNTVMKTTKCSCKSSKCQGGRCACSKQNLKCTDLCACEDCMNQCEGYESEADDVYDDSDDDI